MGVHEGSCALSLVDGLPQGADLHLVEEFKHTAGWRENWDEHAVKALVSRAAKRRGGPSLSWHVASSEEAARGWPTPVDLVVIDGDHSRDACRSDWELWSPHVRIGGIVAFHGARGGDPGPTAVVTRAVRRGRPARLAGAGRARDGRGRGARGRDPALTTRRAPDTIARWRSPPEPRSRAASASPSAGRPAGLPAVRKEELRRHLPGVEPERRLTDWGRSERIEGLMDRTLYDFFYRYWFRAEVEGIENVPAAGGALLVSNHSGALPPDAAMITKAIREEHPQPRSLNITVEHFFKGYPGFSMLMPKIGCVPAHPANVHRLLFDEEQLVLVFPEGRKGTEKLYKDRYRLRRFGRGGFVEAAMRAQVPIVPVCVVGAEEAAPVFAQMGLLKRVTGLLYFPITPTFPHLGLAGMLGYLPAKFKIRFLEPIRFDEEGLHEDKALVQTTAHEVRGRIQEGLWDMLAERKSVWFG